jgi:hypothetical protein
MRLLLITLSVLFLCAYALTGCVGSLERLPIDGTDGGVIERDAEVEHDAGEPSDAGESDVGPLDAGPLECVMGASGCPAGTVCNGFYCLTQDAG